MSETIHAKPSPGAVAPFRVSLGDAPIEGAGDTETGLLVYRTLIAAERTPSNELICGVTEFPPGGYLNLHRHAPAELYFGLAGRGDVTIDGKTYPIAKDVAVFIPGSAEHGVTAGPDGLTFFYCFAGDRYDEIRYDFTPVAG